jgi:hypothetical protein
MPADPAAAIQLVDNGSLDGQLTSHGQPVTFALVGGDLVGTINGTTEVIRIEITGAVDNGDGTVTYSYTTTLSEPVQHADVGNNENSITLTGVDFTVTDSDGDPVDGSFNIAIVDDVPSVLDKSNLVFANTNNDDGGPLPGGTGVFDYNIGADTRTSFSSSNSDFSAITLSGSVDGTFISNPSVTWNSENASTAVFLISFDYAPNPDDPSITTTATGTLTFDKVAGTYTVELNEPIQSFTVSSTSDALGFTEYQVPPNGTGSPEVVVAQLETDFFVQFTGGAATGGGNSVPLSSNNSDNDANTGYEGGDFFTAPQSSVQVSNISAGVGGNTLQRGEVLDLDFHKTNPGSDTSLTPDATASAMFLKFDGIGASDDLVVILKLVDAGADGILGTGDDAFTTKAIVVDSTDIYKFGDTLPTGYGVTLDNNDGLVIIESNDYNGAGENWLIYGAQILSSTEGISGSGIDLNSGTGNSGASTGTDSFGADTTDGDVIKITDIGFVTSTTETEDANLSFEFEVVDADGDSTGIQTLDVTIEGSTTFTGSDLADSIQGSDGDDVLNGGGGDDILNGGGGDDILAGGLGQDTFVWKASDVGGVGDPAGDTVTDFNVAQDDVLDVADLLGDGLAMNAVESDGHLQLQFSDGGNVVQTIDLANVAVADNAAATNLMNQLIADGNIVNT